MWCAMICVRSLHYSISIDAMLSNSSGISVVAMLLRVIYQICVYNIWFCCCLSEATIGFYVLCGIWFLFAAMSRDSFARLCAYSQCFVVHFLFTCTYFFGSHAFLLVLMNEKNAKNTTTQSIMPLFVLTECEWVCACLCMYDCLSWINVWENVYDERWWWNKQ